MALIEGKHTAEFLLSEGNGSISREVGVLAATTTGLEAGTVLGKVTATGHLVPYLNSASDGSQTAVSILYANAPIATGTQEATVIARTAEVTGAELTGIDAAAVIELEARGIVVRGPLPA
jgi:hypothetical protein